MKRFGRDKAGLVKQAVVFVRTKNGNGNHKESRAHQNQHRKWRETPEYNKLHLVYKICKEENKKLCEFKCEEEEMYLNGKRLVLTESMKRSKRQRRKTMICLDVEMKEMSQDACGAT